MDNKINWPTFRGRYAHLSRGRHYAKHIETETWAKRPLDSLDNVLVLSRPGKWFCGSTDGFSRKEKKYVFVEEDGTLIES